MRQGMAIGRRHGVWHDRSNPLHDGILAAGRYRKALTSAMPSPTPQLSYLFWRRHWALPSWHTSNPFLPTIHVFTEWALDRV